MASTTSTREVRSPTRPPLTFPILLGLVCLLGGLSLAVTAMQHLPAFGGDSRYLQHALALNQPSSSELADALGPAGDSFDTLSFVLGIAWVAVAGIMMLVASGFFLTSAQLRHPDAARRVAAVGLWMALGVAVVGILPIKGGWAEAGIGSPTGGFAVEGLRTGFIALSGLFLLQVSAPQWRASVRQAFRD